MKTDRLLILAMAAAVLCGALLCAGLYQKHQGVEKVLADLTAELEASTAAWNATNDAKVPLQNEKKALDEQTRDAELRREESEQKSADIMAQLETLSAQRAETEAAITAAQAGTDAAKKALAEASARAEALRATEEALRDAMDGGGMEAVGTAAEALRALLEE